MLKLAEDNGVLLVYFVFTLKFEWNRTRSCEHQCTHTHIHTYIHAYMHTYIQHQRCFSTIMSFFHHFSKLYKIPQHERCAESDAFTSFKKATDAQRTEHCDIILNSQVFHEYAYIHTFIKNNGCIENRTLRHYSEQLGVP